MNTLILGGMRSGKSRMGERLALASGKQVVCIATALPGDAEMCERIARHRNDRPPDWLTVEEPYALAATMQAQAASDHCLLVDCLTLWLTQLLCADDALLQRERTALLEIYGTLPGEVIMVSNETGLGIVPMDPLSRAFCDVVGRLHQDLAQQSERVIFMVAGLPMLLKGVLS
jgi:adenosylcobinamide kinase / adenosylcobinamide-phosphate guanylyltransferase